MTIRVDGEHLNIENVNNAARLNTKLEIHPAARERIIKCREFVEKKIRDRAVMYGITTGIGELSEVILTPDQLQDFQRYLIYSHAAGCGQPVSIEDVRAAMLSRINVLCKGHSAVRPVVVDTMVQMLNKGVTPVMCQKGSVGASGDLAPMAQMALVLMGEGEAFYKGDRLPGKTAMEKAGIPILTFEARDGLAVINGSNLTTGMGCLQIYDAERLTKTSEIAAAMTLEVLNANMLAYDERLHKARGYEGSVLCAENIRRLTSGSELLAQRNKKVQDAYSLRSTPQVVGPVKHTLEFARNMFLTELNGVGDNPLFFPEENNEGIVITGANFQGTPLAFPLEFLGTAIATLTVLSERRTNRLMNPHLSAGLPAFLTKGAGMFSGMMLTQYTAGSLVCENRILSHPAATGSIPAAADQEDFVSMGMTTAIKTRQILENSNTVIAIELLAGAQALDFRKPLKPGKGVQAAYNVIRKHIEFMIEDRPLYADINKLTEVVKSGEILEAVQSEIGALK
ncbi:MAG: histidine ammonia-lyase [Candidatus Schekmanbacteria bacterium RBG_13_48_7]|uniref:Histidine ammonia-lyase n=1 Tax=Candidatus Schekmanbacteria bacterium RBG_13_48_7 TaxID=1817878 RepID=A0A1F7RW45_9BACT|nr:MAG: histidine ammonia-lyase [Candidatus Schekmanbacteria bacterium RBG_13_48_7]